MLNICPNCSNETPSNDFAFCPSCGQKLKTVQKSEKNTDTNTDSYPTITMFPEPRFTHRVTGKYYDAPKTNPKALDEILYSVNCILALETPVCFFWRDIEGDNTKMASQSALFNRGILGKVGIETNLVKLPSGRETTSDTIIWGFSPDGWSTFCKSLIEDVQDRIERERRYESKIDGKIKELENAREQHLCNIEKFTKNLEELTAKLNNN